MSENKKQQMTKVSGRLQETNETIAKYSSMFAVWKVLHLAEFKGENVIFSVHSFHFILHVVISHLHIYYI